MLISVHIPKTGGSSFRNFLQSVYKEKLFLDYNDHPMTYSAFIRIFTALSKRNTSKSLHEKYECIHGHFLPIKYSLLKEKSFAIWFRDPVERIVSRYYHGQRNFNPNGLQFKKYVKKQNISLEEFIRIKHYQNLYSKYLFGVKLEDFDFIGITENYTNSLEIFKKLYNVNIKYNSIPINTNPKKNDNKYLISDSIKNLILKCNKKDHEIYLKALQINKSLERKYLGDTHR